MNPSNSKLSGFGLKDKFVSAVRSYPAKVTITQQRRAISGSRFGKSTSRPVVRAFRDYPPFCGSNCPRLSKEEYLRGKGKIGGDRDEVERVMVRKNNGCGERAGVELEDADMEGMEINGEGVEVGISVPGSAGTIVIRVGISGTQPVRSIVKESLGIESLASMQKTTNVINAVEGGSVRGGNAVAFSGNIDVYRQPEKMFKTVEGKGMSRDFGDRKKAEDCFNQMPKRKSSSYNKTRLHKDFSMRTKDFHPSNERNAGTVPKSSGGRDAIKRPPLVGDREKVLDTLRLFREMFVKVSQEGCHRRVDLEAAGRLKNMNKWINKSFKIVGPIPGVEVGDKFQYRMELSLIGLHNPSQGGIDYVNHKGQVIATSIIESGGYQNYNKGSGVLIYMGQGGAYGKKPPEDQKLERGNLALKNSISAKNPVRVTRKQPKLSLHPRTGNASEMYIYDGLYRVTKYWPERGGQGKLIFKFQLEKIANIN